MAFVAVSQIHAHSPSWDKATGERRSFPLSVKKILLCLSLLWPANIPVVRFSVMQEVEEEARKRKEEEEAETKKTLGQQFLCTAVGWGVLSPVRVCACLCRSMRGLAPCRRWFLTENHWISLDCPKDWEFNPGDIRWRSALVPRLWFPKGLQDFEGMGSSHDNRAGSKVGHCGHVMVCLRRRKLRLEMEEQMKEKKRLEANGGYELLAEISWKRPEGLL